MESTNQVPTSGHAVLRIVLDVVLGSLVAGLPVYIATDSVKNSVLVGISAGVVVLQSRLAPDLDKMNRQRAVEKATPAVVPKEESG